MRKGFKTFDAHVHVFHSVHGRNLHGVTSSWTHGRILAEDGYETQFMPDCGESMTAYSALRLIRDMDAVGIDKALLLQNVGIGSRNEELLSASREFKGRLFPVFQMDPRDEGAPNALAEYQEGAPFSGLKFEISRKWGWRAVYPDLRFDEPNILRLCERAAKDRRVIIIDAGPADEESYQIKEIENTVCLFPETDFIIEHIGYYADYYDKNPVLADRWRKMADIACYANAYLGLATIAVHAGSEKRAKELLRTVAERYGTEKLIWGTDLPSTLKSYTYEDQIDLILDSEFLTDVQKKQIVYGNICKVLRLPDSME